MNFATRPDPDSLLPLWGPPPAPPEGGREEDAPVRVAEMRTGERRTRVRRDGCPCHVTEPFAVRRGVKTPPADLGGTTKKQDGQKISSRVT